MLAIGICRLLVVWPMNSVTSGQSFKHFTLVNYNSRVVITSKLLILRTLES